MDWWRLAPTLVSIALALVYLVLKPRSPDLAAHLFRSDLFGREGFTIWNGQWYGGHHTPAYSLLSPPLGWLLGPQLMGALSAVGATVCFTELARRHFGPEAARLGTIWFGVGSATLLFTNRLPFALGTAFALAAALALQRDRPLLAPAAGRLSAISSPVAGLFAGDGRARLRAGRARRGRARSSGGQAWRWPPARLVPPIAAHAGVPRGRLRAVPVHLLPADPAVRRGGAAACCRAPSARCESARCSTRSARRWPWSIPTAMGGNAVRLGALVGGPLLACVAGRPRRLARPVVPMVALLAALAFWQWSPAARDIYKAATDPVAKASYFDPVREYLRLLPDQRRVEIPFTLGHWEGAEVGSEAPLARGWLRQLDTGRHPIFYKDGMNELTYASWLSENAVRYVALPDAKPDRSSYRETALIETRAALPPPAGAASTTGASTRSRCPRRS